MLGLAVVFVADTRSASPSLSTATYRRFLRMVLPAQENLRSQPRLHSVFMSVPTFEPGSAWLAINTYTVTVLVLFWAGGQQEVK